VRVFELVFELCALAAICASASADTIVMGSGSGNWPALIPFFHGTSSLRELELLVDAGLTPLEAITAATSRAAQVLKIDREVGTIAAGKRADLLLVSGDPSRDVRAIRSAEWVIRDGAARRPKDWLH
jgi:hypothetical protein